MAYWPPCSSACGCRIASDSTQRSGTRMTEASIRRGLDAVPLFLLTGTFGYLAYCAFEPWRDPELGRRLFSPQEGSCVIRQDVCKVVDHLRGAGAMTYEMSTDLTPEL